LVKKEIRKKKRNKKKLLFYICLIAYTEEKGKRTLEIWRKYIAGKLSHTRPLAAVAAVVLLVEGQS
jgi:hypothetical protein